MTPAEFAAKWKANTTKEIAGSKEHFIDLCRMLGYPTPTELDPTGDFYAFEKALTKASGGGGFADVWKKGYFAWEYKGPNKATRMLDACAAAHLVRERWRDISNGRDTYPAVLAGRAQRGDMPFDVKGVTKPVL